MLKWFKKLLGPQINSISPKQAEEKVKAGALLLDVRTPYERSQAKIPGSKGIPLQELVGEWESLPKDQPVVCHCASGVRSRQAAAFLASKGFEVYNLSGGIGAWQTARLPVKKG